MNFKSKTVFFLSALLVGCQMRGQDIPADPSGASGKDKNAAQESTSTFLPKDERYLTQKNLWSLISDELNMQIPENHRIYQQKQKVLKNKGNLQSITLQAEPYMYWIVEQIKKRNMPMEIVLLPIMESAFNPHATSPANAAGLWQIVPHTGRRYGLKKNQWYDGRFDIADSTTAALDILQRLNVLFDGDWLLTIAAYNSGEGRIIQAIKSNQAKGKPTNFWALPLPRETEIYIPKMLALGDIIKHNKKYGIKLPHPDENRALTQIEMTRQIHLNQVAEMAGIPLKKLKAYNPGYTRNITTPNGPHYIMLPKSHMNQFLNALSRNNATTARFANSILKHNK